MDELGLINENQLGITNGHEDIKNSLEAQFKGETGEIGLYLAMARVAQREGYAEIGEILEKIAFEEAQHAARYAEINGKISTSTKANLEQMLRGEIGSNKMKKDLAKKAKEENLDEVHDFMDEASRDEARHAKMLKGLLDRYFK
ncbi:rubrerythrin family protein [Clostridium niameyense]|uniref:Rubrerythrin family protein n=1 Tax=Clostridium niameyense TaxID=1622073 RepID=A0A6M0R9M4_9CLOT|nr:ferritin family protein [Clostridium niameyense]NEZ46965.1 rubrerythrin family protein [Clostridium niameyense]